jgi:glucose-specific phosphotransferase system IIA component
MGFFSRFKKVKEEFVSPMTGVLMNIENVPDPVFSSKAMGDGFAVDFAGGKVAAPVSGEIAAVFPTGHAYGIRTEDGMEILIHIGMDTVQLEGNGFEILVKAGDKVTQGQILAKVDGDYIKSQGKSLISPIIFTSGENIKLLKEMELVKMGESGSIEIVEV